MRIANSIVRVKNAVMRKFVSGVLSAVGPSGWFPLIREPYSGAWQRNDPLAVDTALSFYAVFACHTLIAGDTAKLGFKLKRKTEEGIWQEVNSPTYSKILKKPNRFQTHIQFKEYWMNSKLSHGNTYVLKERNREGVVVALYVLDPTRVTVLVAPDGGVYYQLGEDSLNSLNAAVIVPSSEIIHDRFNCLFHPLVGISPLFAACLSAQLGMELQQDSKNFFKNGSRPSGILTAPGSISDAVANRLKSDWQSNYAGENSGKVAVLGDNLKFEPMRSTAVDSQLAEQLKLSAEVVCSVYHVPLFKANIGNIPGDVKVENLNQIYYSDCLQRHFEDMEACLDEGLGIPETYSIELDVEGLLRMDTQGFFEMLGSGVKNSLLQIDEARKKINYGSVEGGASIYMQQQNYSLAALAKRDAKDDPFAKDGKTAAEKEEVKPEETSEEDQEQTAKLLALFLQKELS